MTAQPAHEDTELFLLHFQMTDVRVVHVREERLLCLSLNHYQPY